VEINDERIGDVMEYETWWELKVLRCQVTDGTWVGTNGPEFTN
jgi:hypothetical protein